MLEMLTFKSIDSYQTLACSAAVHLSLTHVNRCQMPNNTHLQITPTHGNVEVETGVPLFSVYVSKYKNMYAQPSKKSNLGSF